MARGTADVRGMRDLNTEAFARVFRAYFDTDEVEVLDAGEFAGLGGVNEHYNSDIKKAEVKVKVRGEEREMHMVVKYPLEGAFHKFTSKTTRTFMKEHFWYNQVAKVVGEKFPKIRGKE